MSNTQRVDVLVAKNTMIEKCNQVSETKMNNIKGNQVKTNKKG